MQFLENNKLLIVFIVLFVMMVLLLVANLLAVFYNGASVAAPNIPREETTIGEGEELNYLILGDSTSIAQGGDYDQGFAVKTAENLSMNYKVTYQNFGVSGARISDVATDQLERSKNFNPDVVLIAAGANDVTHLTSPESIKTDLETIISTLRERNSDAKLIFTGAASMGDVQRFVQPFKWFMGARTDSVNKVFEELAMREKVSFAYIARYTGKQFAEHPEYFAQDKFHPNNQGYAVWTEVLNRVIDSSISE
jgi:lysophospholipase L1-like esterase